MTREDKELLISLLKKTNGDGLVYDKKMDEICKDGYYILRPLGNGNFFKVYNYPPYNLTIPTNKVKEIKLPKPLGEIFWNDLI